MAGRDAILQARCPADLRVIGRALGVNMSEAAVRGVVQAICAAAGVTGHESLSSELEIALLATLRSRRDELASELEDLTNYITRIEGLEKTRQQKQVEEQLEVRRQQQQAVTVEGIRIAKERFDAILRTVPDRELAPLRDALETDDLGAVAATMAEALVAQNGLSMPPGSDPAQWLVDHLVATRDAA